jgi:hypothetical protein
MKRLVSVLSIVCLPAVAFAGIQDGRTGPGARIGSDSTSVGAVFEMASAKPSTIDPADGKPKFGDAETSMALLLDVQLPLGPAPVRIRVPFLLSGPGDSESGIGNVAVGVAKGLELGVGIDTAFVVGVDILLPTQSKELGKVQSLSPYRFAEFFPKQTSLVAHTALSVDTPIVDARLDLDYTHGLHNGLDLPEGFTLSDIRFLRLGATASLALLPLVQVVVGLDWMKSVADDADDASTYARVGVRGGLAVVDFGLEANLPLGGPVADAEAQGVGIVASVSAGF